MTTLTKILVSGYAGHCYPGPDHHRQRHCSGVLQGCLARRLLVCMLHQLNRCQALHVSVTHCTQINDIIPKLDSASAQKVQEIESQLQMLEGQVISVTNSVSSHWPPLLCWFAQVCCCCEGFGLVAPFVL